MKKLILPIILNSFLLFTFSINNGNSQWVQGEMISGGYISSLAVSGNNIFAGTQSVYRSANNGINWTQTPLNVFVTSLAASGNYVFAGTYSGVYLSVNNGQSWDQTPLNNQWILCFAVSGSNIFAGTYYDYGVFISTNYGQSWVQTTLNNQTVLSLAVSGGNIFAGTKNGVFLSLNNGQTWTQTALNDKWISSLAVIGNSVFAGTNYFGVYVSTNGGQTWTQTVLNNLTVYSLAVSGNNIFAGTEGSGVYLSQNNGQQWIQKNQGFTTITTVNALLIANNYIFAGTDGQSVWRRELSEITGLKNNSIRIPSSFSLNQNYPNPFNPTTKIKFDVPKTGFVTVKVFDALGRDITTLINEQLTPGTYQTEWNAENYPSGVYYYRLTTDGFTEKKKMILLK